MTEKNTGGPAFPWCGDLNDCPTINLGMTLRDYFAAAALTGIAAHAMGPEKRELESNADAHARWSFRVADAMIEARNK